MRKLMYLTLAVCLMMAGAVAANAAEPAAAKIGVVDMQAVATQSEPAQAAKKQMESKYGKERAALEKQGEAHPRAEFDELFQHARHRRGSHVHLPLEPASQTCHYARKDDGGSDDGVAGSRRRIALPAREDVGERDDERAREHRKGEKGEKGCGKIFADESATEETTLEALTIAPLGHDYTLVATVADKTYTEGDAFDKNDVSLTLVCSRGDSSIDVSADEAAIVGNVTLAEGENDYTASFDGHGARNHTPICDSSSPSRSMASFFT